MFIVRSEIGTIVGDLDTMENLCELLVYARRGCIERNKFKSARTYEIVMKQIMDELRRVDKNEGSERNGKI